MDLETSWPGCDPLTGRGKTEVVLILAEGRDELGRLA